LTIWACTGFDIWLKLKMHVEVNRWPRKKSIKKLRAEDNTDSILAEAEHIFNNADEVLASFADEEYLLAA
jgi:hypothetical protein